MQTRQMGRGTMKPKTQEEIQAWIINWLQEKADIPRESIDLDKPFADYHLDSLTSVELGYDIEEWSGGESSPATREAWKARYPYVWNYLTINKMSEYLSRIIEHMRSV